LGYRAIFHFLQRVENFSLMRIPHFGKSVQ